MDLFSPSLLNRLTTLPKDPSLVLRPLNTKDYDKGDKFIYLLFN